MANTIAPLVNTVEQTLLPLGLMTGTYAVPKRMVFGAVVGGAVVSWLKPGAMFSPDGRMRPWNVSQPDPGCDGVLPTNTPWWIGPGIGAFLFGVLI
jgi:hypothetical protein